MASNPVDRKWNPSPGSLLAAFKCFLAVYFSLVFSAAGVLVCCGSEPMLPFGIRRRGFTRGRLRDWMPGACFLCSLRAAWCKFCWPPLLLITLMKSCRRTAPAWASAPERRDASVTGLGLALNVLGTLPACRKEYPSSPPESELVPPAWPPDHQSPPCPRCREPERGLQFRSQTACRPDFLSNIQTCMSLCCMRNPGLRPQLTQCAPEGQHLSRHLRIVPRYEVSVTRWRVSLKSTAR